MEGQQPRTPCLGVFLFVGGILVIFLAFVVMWAMTPVDGSPNSSEVGGLLVVGAALLLMVLPGGIIISRARK